MNRLLCFPFLFRLWLLTLLLPGSTFARETTTLTEGWKFYAGEVTNGSVATCLDADWSAVSLPHCWGWAEAQRGEKYYRGPGWYRTTLAIAPVPGKRYYLRFEAAAIVAEVYLNGVHLGGHRGGFGAFCFEITSQLSRNGTNLLAVRVSNAAAPEVAPLSGDFNVYGGLYRPVHLIMADQTSFALTDHASAGVAWLSRQVTATQAVLDVTAQVDMGPSTVRSGRLATKILTAAGQLVMQTNETIQLVPGMVAPYWSHLVVPTPHLWQGRRDPYLYQAVVELQTTNGALLDSVTQQIGLRSCVIDPEKGFLLNGQPYPLHGVCRHQDRQDKGWAISSADMAEDVALLQEMGVNAVRCAHYQHSDYFYQLCDQAGLLVWAEIPQVNDIENTALFAETSRNQLLDLIRQNINHPSIFVWSLFNEVGNGHTQDPHRELQDLNILAHGEDPARPTVAATCTTKFPQMNQIPDFLGWNIYPGWYGDKDSLAQFGAWLDAHRYNSRAGGFCLSEYGAGANIRQHSATPSQPKTTGPWHPEEYQAIVHEQAWAAIQARPYIWGSFLWNMFDFCVADRHEGSLPALNDKGLVTYDRKNRKDAFYFYQANWSDTPMLHLTSQRYTERTNAVAEVKIYANVPTVELLVNGASLGQHTGDSYHIFRWADVRLNPSITNRIQARAVVGNHVLQDECAWVVRKSD